jgi:hypothetical protein
MPNMQTDKRKAGHKPPHRLAHVLPAAVIGGALLLSIVNLRTEWTVAQMSRHVAAHTLPPAAIDPAQVYPPRAAFMAAGEVAHSAASTSGVQRGILLDRAERWLRDAKRGRPQWGQTYVLAAYIAGLRAGGSNPASTRLVAQSYALSPFLRGESDWRIRYVSANWAIADQRLRRAMLEEAIWASSRQRSQWLHVRLLLEATPAYAPYLDLRARLLR